MNEFGETPTYYIFPIGHEEGEPFPEDFRERIYRGLASEGLTSEPT